MNWYLAKFVYRIICGDGNHTAQFDEQLRLIKAGDEEQAMEYAKRIGKNEEATFYNQKQQLVKWQFITVSELYQFSELTDGAEIYSQIHEAEDAQTH